MTSAVRALFLLAPAIASIAALAWQSDAPPAVGQDGVVNSASQMPPEFGGGAIARGSLIRIRGWRLGPEAVVRAGKFPLAVTLADIWVEIRQGAALVNAFPVSVAAGEIEAIVPSDAPLGNAELLVRQQDNLSPAFPIRIVESSFGAYSRNGLGWGPGEVSNGLPGENAPANSLDHPAQPGEPITVAGTGLGAVANPDNQQPRRQDVQRPMAITAAGRLVTRIRYAGRSSCCVGRDELSFDLPRDTPEGCYVPLQVQSAPGVMSNIVTVAVSRSRGPCKDPGNWLQQELGGVRRAGIAGLLHADLFLSVDRQETTFRFDAGFAQFVEVPAGPVRINPFYLFPPYGSCTGYNRIVHGGEIISGFSSMSVIRGVAMDAGRSLTVRAGEDQRSIGLSSAGEKTFASVLGGRSPFPGVAQFPLFLRPQSYEIFGGGEEVGAFRAAVSVSKFVRWNNRRRVTAVDRLKGVTVHWTPARLEDSIVITAMNLDSRTGAFGVCECLAQARTGHFSIPAAALTNVPATRGGDSLPLNFLLISEFPGQPAEPFTASGLDRGFAFFLSSSARLVEYR